MRSVADSNRRTRFCRPLPSHSANRPTLHISQIRCAKIIKYISNQQEDLTLASIIVKLVGCVVVYYLIIVGICGQQKIEISPSILCLLSYQWPQYDWFMKIKNPAINRVFRISNRCIKSSAMPTVHGIQEPKICWLHRR